MTVNKDEKTKEWETVALVVGGMLIHGLFAYVCGYCVAEHNMRKFAEAEAHRELGDMLNIAYEHGEHAFQWRTSTDIYDFVLKYVGSKEL